VKNGFLSAAPSMPNTLGWKPAPPGNQQSRTNRPATLQMPACNIGELTVIVRPIQLSPAMNILSVFHSSFRTRRIRLTVGALLAASSVLVAIGICLGDAGFFLRWFFGFQADD
ncbi:MAG: hypothetical protein V4726_17300, partial [Verrucomicrobiota bacterium]